MDSGTKLNLKEVNNILEMIYWLYLKDLKNGNLKDGICSENRQAVGKSSTKRQTFHQTAFNYEK